MFGKDIGIDFGTCNTLVCVRGDGIILSEPSVVAVRKNTREVLMGGQAVGNSAKDMIGKTPGQIEAVRPLRDGVISDFDCAESLLTYFIRKVCPRRGIFGPRVAISVPAGVTEVEKQAVVNSARHAGARRVYLFERPVAAGIGAGLPIQDPVGSMILDIGGGVTEIAVLSLGGVVTLTSLRIAGDEMDEAILQYLKRTYNLLVGEQTAERIKIEIGSAFPLTDEMDMEIKGRDLVRGIPRTLRVSSVEIREALQEPVTAIVNALRESLERTPPELAADIVDRGIYLSGGGALLRGLDLLMREVTNLNIRVAQDPLTCVVLGAGRILEQIEDFEKVILTGHKD